MSPPCPHLFDSLGLAGVRFHLEKDCEGESALNTQVWMVPDDPLLSSAAPSSSRREEVILGGRTQA